LLTFCVVYVASPSDDCGVKTHRLATHNRKYLEVTPLQSPLSSTGSRSISPLALDAHGRLHARSGGDGMRSLPLPCPSVRLSSVHHNNRRALTEQLQQRRLEQEAQLTQRNRTSERHTTGSSTLDWLNEAIRDDVIILIIAAATAEEYGLRASRIPE